MAKNKGKYRSAREKEKDVAPEQQISSLTARVFTQLRPHAFKIGAVILGLVAVLAGFSIYSWYIQRRDTRASQAFADVMEILRTPVTTEDPTAPTPAPTPKPDEGPKFKTEKEKKETALAKIQTIEKEYGSSGVAKQVSIVKASLLYDLGRWDDAVAAYKEALAKAEGEVAFVAREGLGYTIEAKALETAKSDAEKAKAMFAEALREFEALAPQPDSPHRDLALYHQARVKALQGDRKGAIELYKQIQEKFPTSPILADVENRLEMLEEQS